MKQTAPATGRNREPIRQVLARHLPTSWPSGRKTGDVLEIAAGTGEHAVYMAAAFPQLTWRPSDRDPVALASIAAWRDEAALPNLEAPVALDVMSPAWPIDRADAIVCINMVHIAPWAAAEALFAGADRTLGPAGILYLYGPYRIDGEMVPSNAEFDRSLRARDPTWGVREIGDLSAAAGAVGLGLRDVIAMPANNHSLIFGR